MAKAATVKPFRLDECKSGPNGRVHEITVNKWKGMDLTSIRKEEKWIQFLPDTGTIKEWGPRKETDRSLDGDQKAANARHIDDMLEFVAQFAPSCLYRDITAKAKSLKEVWTLINEWACIKPHGCNHQTYNQIRKNYRKDDPDKNIIDLYYEMKNAKEDCLLKSATTKFRSKGASQQQTKK